MNAHVLVRLEVTVRAGSQRSIPLLSRIYRLGDEGVGGGGEGGRGLRNALGSAGGERLDWPEGRERSACGLAWLGLDSSRLEWG